MSSLRDLVPRYLHTKRLTLELFNASPESGLAHYDWMISTMKKMSKQRSLGGLVMETHADVDAFNMPKRLKMARFKDGIADGDLLYMIREGPDRPDGEVAGTITVSHRMTSDVLLPVDIGWALSEEKQGRGYATEAAAEVLRWLVAEFGLEDIAVYYPESNEASLRVATRLGFVAGGHVLLRNVVMIAMVRPGREWKEVALT